MSLAKADVNLTVVQSPSAFCSHILMESKSYSTLYNQQRSYTDDKIKNLSLEGQITLVGRGQLKKTIKYAFNV